MFFFFAPCEKVWDRFQSRFPRQYRTDHTDPNRTNPFARNPIASEEGGRFHRSVNYSLHLNEWEDGARRRGDAHTSSSVFGSHGRSHRTQSLPSLFALICADDTKGQSFARSQFVASERLERVGSPPHLSLPFLLFPALDDDVIVHLTVLRRCAQSHGIVSLSSLAFFRPVSSSSIPTSSSRHSSRHSSMHSSTHPPSLSRRRPRASPPHI